MANVNKGTSAAEGDEGVTNISEAHADQEQKDHSDEVSHQQQQKQVSSTSVSIMPSANYENDQCVEVVGKLSYLTKYIQQCQELVDHVQSCDVLNVVNVLNQAMEIATGIRDSDTAIQTVERCQTVLQGCNQCQPLLLWQKRLCLTALLTMIQVKDPGCLQRTRRNTCVS